MSDDLERTRKLVQEARGHMDRAADSCAATIGALVAAEAVLARAMEGPGTEVLDLHERGSWGAKHGRGNVTSGAGELVIIHHFASPHVPADATPEREREVMRAVEHHHAVTSGWAGIGYNHVIFQSGRVYEGRGWGRIGAHTAGHNSSSAGIAFAIDGQSHAPTDAAMEACRDLIAEGVRLGRIAPSFDLKGHRDFGQTKCPGDKLYPLLPDLTPTVK